MGSTGVESGSNLRQRVKQSVTGPDLPDEPPLQIATLTPPLGQFVISTVLSVAGLVAAVAFGVFAILSVRLSQDANAQTFAQNQLALLGLCVGNNDYSGSAECSRVVAAARNIIPSVASQLSIPIGSGSGSTTTSITSGPVNSPSPPPVLVITSVSTSGTGVQTFLSTVSSTSLGFSSAPASNAVSSAVLSTTSTSASSSITSIINSAIPEPPSQSDKSGVPSHTPTGTIVGASIGSVVGLIIILSTIVWWTVRRGRKAITAEQQYEDEKQKPPSFMTRLGVGFRSLFIDSTVGFRSAQ